MTKIVGKILFVGVKNTCRRHGAVAKNNENSAHFFKNA
jgi:hypothetical protein